MSAYKDYIADPTRDCAIVAHRAAWHNAPENSLLAMQHAIDEGYKIIEIDIRKSADGELFILHDDTLTRMAGRDVVAEDLTLKELADIRLRTRDGGANNAVTGEHVPSLKEVFELTRGNVFIDLDMKHLDMLPEVLSLAKDMGVNGEVDIKADLQTRAQLEWLQREIPMNDIAFMPKSRLSPANAAEVTTLLTELSPFMCETSFDSLELVAERREIFRSNDIALWFNSLDCVADCGLTDSKALSDPDAIWGTLIDAGFSTIQTDEPEALSAYLKARLATPRRMAGE